MKPFYQFILVFILSLFFIKLKLHGQSLQNTISFSEHLHVKNYHQNKNRHPEIFQGNKKHQQYFEGWYFKMVDFNGQHIMSVIPGISLSKDGKTQTAFIQIIDGKTAKTNYYTFPIGSFSYAPNDFAVKIGDNYFSKDKLILNINQDSSHVFGEVNMYNGVALKSDKRFNAGIMGWYRFVPYMQCYHGLVSMTHYLQGGILKDGESFDFNEGKGYIEKDWGSSMPSAWIWMQSNNFTQANNSFMLSIANVPWLGKSFTGFLGFFLQDGTVHRFATYTHAKLKIKKANSDTVLIEIKNKKLQYVILALKSKAGLLKAPLNGSMDRRIAESVDAKLILTVYDKKNNLIFKDSSNIAGLEMVGNLLQLQNNSKRKRAH